MSMDNPKSAGVIEWSRILEELNNMTDKAVADRAHCYFGEN